MESRTVNLFGGPYHGEQVAIPTGHNHFHIKVQLPENPPLEGTYSQVTGPNNANNFEWDGWVTH